MATIGQALASPESGWKRYDDSNDAIAYYGAGWTIESSSTSYNSTMHVSAQTTLSDIIRFKFKGSNLRIIGGLYSTYSANIQISIDGVTETFSESGSNVVQALVYEKLGLSDIIHTVEIQKLTNGTNSYDLILDAVDIDITGRLMHPNEVLEPKDLSLGKRIRCHYISNISGAAGSFNGLGQETSDFISATSSATPNGDFYFIAVEDWNGKSILVADRNVQSSISWNTLNANGIASGSGVPINLLYSDVPVFSSDAAIVSNGYTYTVTASSQFSATYAPYKAFNGTNSSNTDCWLFPGASGWIQIDMGRPVSLSSYSIAGRVRYPGDSPRGWTLQASNTGAFSGEQVILSTVSLSASWSDKKSFTVNPYKEMYRYYKVVVTSNGGGTNTGIGQMWFEQTEKENEEYSLSCRLMTGGVSTTDPDNEWNKYIVNSSLNDTIITSDNNIWHWSGVASITSSTVNGTPANRYSRGNVAVSSYYSNASSYVGATTGFRPVLMITLFPPNSTNEISSSFKVPFRSDITSSLYLYRDDYNNGVNSISQRKSSISIPFRNDLLSTITVAPNGYMTGNAPVTPIQWDNLNTTISVKVVSQLISSITIPPHNKLVGLVDVYPIPTITSDVYPLQDAFVRSNIPRLNYGVEQEMVVGENPDTGELYKSLIQFDISSIPEAQKIKEAKLHIYYEHTSDLDSANVNIYELLNVWTETGVTWANVPKFGELITTFETGIQSGYISIDITDIVNAWYLDEKINNGFLLDGSTQQVYRFRTKERLANSPYLTIDYFDPIVRSIGIIETPSTITVNQIKNIELTSTITVVSSYRTEEFPSSIHILNQDMVESEITVNKPILPVMISIRRNGTSEITGSFVIQGKDNSDFESNVQISHPFLTSELIIRRSSDSTIISDISVKATKTSRLVTTFDISRPIIPSSLSVYYADLLDSNITIRDNNFKELPSSVSVRRDSTKDLTGSLNVWMKSELLSNVFVISGYLASSITIPYSITKDFKSTIFIREKYAADILTSLGVFQFNSIASEIQIVESGGNVGFVIII